ncbi:MAG: T9SS type A sorting domain-containing protein [Saprospiraceae bacterium]|nr:T9SS type A sorting domain-containing protein [Saprospiraceae bacterium]
MGNSAIECDNPKDINNTRWGDYNGIQKDYSIDPSVHNVSVWLSGTFSFYGARKTWISNIIENSTTNVGEVKIKNDFKLFPNPVQQEFTTSFNIKKSSKYHFKIIDESGKDYKNLFYGNLNSGEKRLTFIKDSIPQGIYFIVLLENGIIIHSEKFVIID